SGSGSGISGSGSGGCSGGAGSPSSACTCSTSGAISTNRICTAWGSSIFNGSSGLAQRRAATTPACAASTANAAPTFKAGEVLERQGSETDIEYYQKMQGLARGS